MIRGYANKITPEFIVTPGEVLQEYLDSFGMSQTELSERSGLHKKTINEIINGKAPITPDTAIKFERIFSRPAHFWINLESNYQEDKLRLIEKPNLEESIDWAQNFPIKSMIKYGWIRKRDTDERLVEELLSFFGVATRYQWDSMWEDVNAYYRQSNKTNISKEAVAAWLRVGEIEGRKISTNRFTKKALKHALKNIRYLSRESPNKFVPKLTEILADSGVAFVIIPELPNTGISGATSWLAKNKALMQISLRYKSNDHFWFTIIHEAAHLLLHSKKELFVEFDGNSNQKEDEANKFAADELIPNKIYLKFLSSWSGRLREIEAFANAIGIAPGIVVGRLQHDDHIEYNTGNRLKIFYKWMINN